MNELILKSPSKKDISTPATEPIQDFLKRLKEKMHQVFHLRGDINQYAQQRGLPPFVMREIMDTNPLSIGIPTEYGGRGAVMRENLSLLEAASYESLALRITSYNVCYTKLLRFPGQ